MRGRRALGALVAGGLLVRGWFMVSARPGFLGYPDAVTYVIAAKEELFWSPYRPAGYPLLLRGLRRADPRLASTVAAQHALGVGTALLLHALTARFARRRELALLPAAVVLGGGTQVALEHSLMSEGPYAFLLAASLSLGARSIGSPRPTGWLAGAGLAAGASATLRSAGLFTVPALAVWARRDALTVVAAAAVPLAAYALAQHRAIGVWALTRTSGLTVYGRTAPLARPGTGGELAEASDPRERANATWYMFTWRESPLLRRHGVPPYPRGTVSPDLYRWPGEEPARRFALAVLRAQPRDYLLSIARGMVNYARPHSSPPGVMGWDHHRLLAELHDPGFEAAARPEMAAYYAEDSYRRRDVGRLDAYARAARLEGAPSALLALAAVAAVAPGGDDHARRAATLLGGTTASMALALVALLFYDVRYATPLYGPLAAAAALGIDRLLVASWP